jgi:hypothetical protein
LPARAIKKSPGAVSSAMNDHTTRRMYTKRAPGDINIYAMNDNLTTQELSKEEKDKQYFRNWYLANKERLAKMGKERRQRTENKERSRAYCAKKRATTEHKQYMREYLEVWNKENKKELREYCKQYYSTNKEILSEKAAVRRTTEEFKEKERYRYRTNPEYKLARLLRGRLKRMLKVNNTTKTDSALSLVGCTVEELKDYIEKQWLPGMTWENHSPTGWHIDHIKPCNTFNLIDIKQQKICFHYTNLRPLWAKDNLSRPDDGSDIITIPTQIQ